ncbi:SDR family oxidoreductase [Streptomyces mirabilis]
MRNPWGASGDRVAAVLTAANRAGRTGPLGRFGSPQEIAETVAFLMPDRATYITGRYITVGCCQSPSTFLDISIKNRCRAPSTFALRSHLRTHSGEPCVHDLPRGRLHLRHAATGLRHWPGETAQRCLLRLHRPHGRC